MKNIQNIYNLLSWTIITTQVSAAPSQPESLPTTQQGTIPTDLQRRQYLATNPQPQYIPQAMAVASSKPAECKNCPYGTCLNALAVNPGTDLGFACWTTGEQVNNDPTWIRHHYGTKLGDFCYVNPYDMVQQSSEYYKSRLPYCGQKSQLNFYLPKATTKTELFTECSLCPYRDCEGIEFYQAGVDLEVNCVLNDGWEQVSPTHESGTKKYYRTNQNCYVSAASVKELPLVSNAEVLPFCGPVPHLRSEDRPNSPAPAAPAAPASPATGSSPGGLTLAPAFPGQPEQQSQPQPANGPLSLAPPLAAAKSPLTLASIFPGPTVAGPKGPVWPRWRPRPRTNRPENQDDDGDDSGSDDDD